MDKTTREEDKLSNSTGEESSLFNMGQNKERNPTTGQLEDTSILSNQELIKLAEEFTEKLELEKAVALYDEGTKRFPNDTIIMDSYTDLLIQLGESEKAKYYIERSIQLNPQKEGLKYLNLAEMLAGNESLQMYRRGIEVLKNDAERLRKGYREEEA